MGLDYNLLGSLKQLIIDKLEVSLQLSDSRIEA